MTGSVDVCECGRKGVSQAASGLGKPHAPVPVQQCSCWSAKAAWHTWARKGQRRGFVLIQAAENLCNTKGNGAEFTAQLM